MRGKAYLTIGLQFSMAATFALAVPCSYAATSKPVIDPYHEESLTCNGKPDGRLFYDFETSGYGHFRIRADLNFDGRKDIILTNKDGPSCGNGGCATVIYLQRVDGSYTKHEFGLHPFAVNLQKAKPGIGILKTYWHMNAEQGIIVSHRITIASVKQTSAITIFPNGRDQALYKSLFNGGSRLQAEYAKCIQGSIQWNSSHE